MAKISTTAEINSVRVKEQATAPSTPASGYGSIYCKSDGLYFIGDDGTEIGPLGAAGSSGVVDIGIVDGRLTLESGVPVSTTDQTAKATLYFTPYKGNRIALYDGSSEWNIRTFSELSLDISGYTTGKNYDIWCYDNSGTATLDSTIWTDDTNRATALTRQDGILVKTGDTTRRYLGTIRMSAAGECEDSFVKRFVWNFYNRGIRPLYISDFTSHTYTTATYRPWNNLTSNRVEFLVGYGILFETDMYNEAKSATGGQTVNFGMGLDSTNSAITTGMSSSTDRGGYTTLVRCVLASEGYHYLQALEYVGAGTGTLYVYRLSARIWG